MARYGASAAPPGVNTANTAYAALIQTGTTQRLLCRQVVVGIAVAPTTAPLLYLARCTARGTQVSTLAGQNFDENDAAPVGTVDVCASATQPTFTNTNRIGIGGLSVTAGGAWVWSFFDIPLVVRATAGFGIVLANANASGATTGTFDVSFLWDE
jgi:hypothetical protein